MNPRRPPWGRPLFWVAAGFLAAALLLAFFLLRSPGRSRAAKAVDPEIEGVDLTYYDFDRNNRKKLEIRCRESQKKGDDRLLMKGVRATIFDTEEGKDDIRVAGNAGTVSNNFHNFFIQGEARISSRDFSLSSPSFNLKDRDILTSGEAVQFKLENAEGQAGGGLRYYIGHKVLKLFGSRGVWTRQGVPYDFRCRVFWVFRKKNLLILDGAAELAGNRSVLRSNWISLQFDEGFATLQTTQAIGKSFFRHQSGGGGASGQEREISAGVIRMENDAEGRLRRILAQGQGRVALIDPASRGELESDEIEIALNPETQSLETVRVLKPGTLRTRGKENVSVRADSLQASYDPQGRLSRVRAEGKCEFSTDDFSGSSASLDHDAAHSLMRIAGEGTSITSKKNTFRSSLFTLDTRQEKLESRQGVQATLVPARRSVLLQAKPVFVTSATMQTAGRGNAALFQGKVKLFQDAVELQAGELDFDNLAGRMTGRGGVDLKFMEEGGLVRLHGNVIETDPKGAKILIDGEARLEQGDSALSAQKIELAFKNSEKLENIVARGDAAFRREDLTGKAQLLHWQYAKKTVWFRKNAEITRPGAGTTRGEELRFDMKSNRITVAGAGDRSQTTIDRELP